MGIQIGDILRITGNSTGHCYENGTRVMVYQTPLGGSCEVSDGKTCQYVREDCYEVEYTDNWMAPNFEKATILQRLNDAQSLMPVKTISCLPRTSNRIRTQKARGLRVVWPLNSRLNKG